MGDVSKFCHILSLDAQQSASLGVQLFLMPVGAVFDFTAKSEIKILVQKLERAGKGRGAKLEDVCPLLHIPTRQNNNLNAFLYDRPFQKNESCFVTDENVPRDRFFGQRDVGCPYVLLGKRIGPIKAKWAVSAGADVNSAVLKPRRPVDYTGTPLGCLSVGEQLLRREIRPAYKTLIGRVQFIDRGVVIFSTMCRNPPFYPWARKYIYRVNMTRNI